MPVWIKNILQNPINVKQFTDIELQDLKQKLVRFSSMNPLVSIVIPAWNEEEGILHTLISLAQTNTKYDVELLVINNNSTDGTASLLDFLGVKNILETNNLEQQY